MKIAISACLLGENCKYNGENNYSEEVMRFIKGHEVIPICPEVEGGMPIPRPAVEIVNGRIQTKDGEDFDEVFRKGARIILERIKKENVDLVILQSRSPSCGVHQIYDGTFSKTLVAGQGILARELMNKGIEVIDVEEIKNHNLEK